MPFQTWAEINKPLEEITKEEKEEYLKVSDYGRCVYTLDRELVDRQTVSVEFDNGAIGSLHTVGATSYAGRWIHVVGTKGEITGRFEDGKIKLIEFNSDMENFGATDRIVDVNNDVVKSVQYAGHGGGDFAIMYDAVRAFAGEGYSISVTELGDSINGHRVVFGAEESRKNKKISILEDI